MSNTFCQESVLHYISQDRRHSRLSSLFGDTDSVGDFHLRPSTKGGSTFPSGEGETNFFSSNGPAMIQSSSSPVTWEIVDARNMISSIPFFLNYLLLFIINLSFIIYYLFKIFQYVQIYSMYFTHILSIRIFKRCLI